MRRANSFGSEAAAYAEHRPDYARDAILWALEPLAGVEGLEVVDLGAGTGKLTDGVAATGARVTAVEPDAGMRAEFERRHPELPILAGSAEHIPLPNDSVHAVVVGQAFHWFDQAAALPEIARVLRPGGVLAAFWNVQDTTVEWVAELHRLSRSTMLVAQSTGEFDSVHPLFEPFLRRDFPHVQRRTADSLAATIGTHSHTLVAPPEERAEILERITAYLRRRPETCLGEFDLPLRTMVIRSLVR
nr:class I SAM-dependent methyltransferase [Nocardia transvalensis]